MTSTTTTMWPLQCIFKDVGRKKSVLLLLKELCQSNMVADYQILTIRNQADAQRKQVQLDDLAEEQAFPLLYVLVRPSETQSAEELVLGRLQERGGRMLQRTTPPAQVSHPQSTRYSPRSIIYDMETSDPDDVLALLFLLGRTDASLKLVTINPGSRDQVGFVHSILNRFSLSHKVLIGSGNPKKKTKVDPFYRKHFDPWEPRDADGLAGELLVRCGRSQTTLITGGALTNVARAIDYGGSKFEIGELVCQGGFASACTTTGHPQLEKFEGLEATSSYNFNANPKAVQKVLAHEGIARIRLVSKNICHRFVFDGEILECFCAALSDGDESGSTLPVGGISEITRIMTAYLSNKEEGKKIHDVIAAACALRPGIATWKQVQVVGGAGGWGTVASSSSSVFVTIDWVRDLFLNVLLQEGKQVSPS